MGLINRFITYLVVIMSTEIFRAILVLIFIISFGHVIFSLVSTKRRYLYSNIEKFVLSWGLGIGVLTFWMLIILGIGIKITLSNSIAPPLIISLAFYIYKRRDFDLQINIKRNKNYLENLLIFVIIISILIISFNILKYPIKDSDALGYALKAKMIFLEGTPFSSDIYDPHRIHPHKDYPILVPLSESLIYFSLGHVDEWVAKLIFLPFFVLLIVFFYASLRNFSVAKETSLLVTAIFATLPELHIFASTVYNAYADLPLTFFYTISVVYLLRWISTRDRSFLVFSSLFSAFSILTKNEGMFLAFLNFTIVVWLLLYRKLSTRTRFYDFCIFSSILILVPLPWLFLKSNLPPPVYNHIQFDLTWRFDYILNLMANQTLFNFKNWGGFWIIFISSLIYAFRRRESLVLNCITFAYFTIFFWIFITWSYSPISLELIVQNFPRFIFHIVPLALMSIGLIFSDKKHSEYINS